MRNTQLGRLADRAMDDNQNVIHSLIEEIEELENQLEESYLQIGKLNDENDNLVLNNEDLKATVIQLQQDLAELAKTFTSSL